MHIDILDFSIADNLPGTPLQQSGTYAAVLCSFGCQSAVIEAREDGALIARARIYTRRIGPLRVVWLPRGPVWATAATPNQMRRTLSALPGAAPWRALWAMGANAGQPHRGLPIARGLQMAELDLTQDDAARRSSQNGKWRNTLKRAEGAGLTITTAAVDITDTAPLLAQEAAQRAKRRYAALPHRFTEKWVGLAPSDTLMLVASEAGTPVAFMLMLLHTPTATYHIGWTGPRGRRLNAHTLLLWRASCSLAQMGYARLDLGSIDAARSPGITRFKVGAGANLRNLGPTTLCL